MKWPFRGQYQGYQVSRVPPEVLVSAYNRAKRERRHQTRLFREVAAVLGVDPDADGDQEAVYRKPIGLEIDDIDQWAKDMLRRYHPDCGGTHAEAVVVTEGRSLLIQMLAKKAGST